VVDDHPAVALALNVGLKPDGRFEIAASAATAAEGLERIEGHDAVVLDLHLPDMEGRPLVEAFRARADGVPLVLHTAADEGPQIDAVRDLVDAVVVKGRMADLVAMLAQVTDI
jgi:DNA-binding NarL/FixJ family response regulator